MEIFLVRHTTPNIEKGICYGHANIGVTASFDKERKHILAALENISNAKIYSSPLQRCKALAASFGEKVYYDDRLKELNFGDWELQAWDKISKSEIDPWMHDFVHVKTTNGESYKDLEKRALTFFREVVLSEAGNKIIVTHAGVIRAIVASLEGIDLKDSFSILLDYGQVISIAQTAQGFRVIGGLTLER